MANAPPPPDWAAHRQVTTASLGPAAGFWIRFVATIIDTIVLSLIAGAMIGVIIGVVVLVGGESRELAAGLGIFFGVIGLIVVGWLYEALLTSSARGATIGKQAIGARIVRADGAQLSFGRATARHFLKVLITPLLPLGIGYIMAGFTRGKRALHDFMADTCVVHSTR